MRLKLRPRGPAKAMTIALNRSKKLEGQPGKYEGRHIDTRYIYLPKIEGKR